MVGVEYHLSHVDYTKDVCMRGGVKRKKYICKISLPNIAPLFIHLLFGNLMK